MSNSKNDIENLFSNKFDGYKLKPSNDVWLNVEKELNKKSFFKYSFSKFNIYYLAVTVLLLTFLTFKLSEKENNKIFTNNSLNITENTIEKRAFYTDNTNNLNTEQSKSYAYTQAETLNSDISFTSIIHENNILNQEKEISKDEEIIEANKNMRKDEENVTKCEKFEVSDCVGCSPLSVKFENKIENADSYFWNFGNGESSTDVNPEYIYYKSGEYYVTLKYTIDDEIGYFYDTIQVFEKPIANFDLSNSNNVLVEEEINFYNKSENAVEFEWDFGDETFSQDYNPVHNYSSIGTYTIKLLAKSTNNCLDSASTSVQVEKKGNKMIFPNAFTPSLSGPNGGYYNKNDVSNDVFFPAYSTPVEDFYISIYNRNGLLVFESNDINIGWDGYYKDVIAKSDVYTYLAKVRFSDGESKVYTGEITVVYR